MARRNRRTGGLPPPRPTLRGTDTPPPREAVEWPAGVTPLRALPINARDLTAMASSPDGRFLATGGRDSIVRVWDANTGAFINQIEGHTGTVWGVSWSPDGAILASCGEDGVVCLWTAAAGEIIGQREGRSSDVWSVSWAADRYLLAPSNGDGVGHVWDATMGQSQRLRERYAGPVHSVSWSPNGGLLASGGDDAVVRVWDTNTGEITLRLEGHTSRVWSASWSPDGALLASGGSDGVVRVWDANTAEPTKQLEGHRGAVYSVSWSPDGGLLASGGHDGVVHVWDVTAAGKRPACNQLEAHTHGVGCVEWTPGGQALLSVSYDGAARLWPTGTWEPVELLTGRAIRVANLRGLPSEGPTYATPGPLGVDIVELDYDVLLGAPPGEMQARYANAKVVLVGETGVGKTGLARALTGKPYEATDSTHGRNVWSLDDVETPLDGGGTETRETLLWDLAGQPGYRVTHQLYLDEVAVALVVMDSRSETDPFAGAQYWSRALKQAHARQGENAPPMAMYLVVARTDRGGISANEERIETVVRQYGFAGYFETSAAQGWGIEELREVVCNAIPWDELPHISSTDLFRRIQRFLVAEKEQGRVLATLEELHRDFKASDDGTDDDVYAEFEACIDRVASRDLILRLPFGDLVLLQPEYIDAYASAIVNAAGRGRVHP